MYLTVLVVSLSLLCVPITPVLYFIFINAKKNLFTEALDTQVRDLLLNIKISSIAQQVCTILLYKLFLTYFLTWDNLKFRLHFLHWKYTPPFSQNTDCCDFLCKYHVHIKNLKFQNKY